jgi:hypothetical protein
MKRLFTICVTLVLLFFFNNPSYSQRTPLPTDSAQWVYKGFANGISDSVYIYRVKGDTILDSKTYSKVYKSNDNDTNYYSTNETIHCFIRNDTNKRAYVRYPPNYCNDSSDILLYDFSLNVGDTFNIPLLQPIISLPCIDTTFTFIVTNRADNVELLSNYYGSQLQLKIFNNQQYYECWGNTCPEEMDDFLIWNEEIGSRLHTTFYNEYEYCACCSPWLYSGFKIECFWEKGKWINGPCALWGIDEETFHITNISPNPFSQYTQITLNQTYQNITLAVYDIQGKLLVQQQYKDCDKIQLSRNQLSNGLYFLKLTLDDKAVETGKILISD